jgi:cupin 2 domain-containing protein
MSLGELWRFTQVFLQLAKEHDMPEVNNLFAGLPEALAGEVFQELLKTRHFRLERIVSHGQASPPGFWYEEPTHEWVAVLSGRAALKFADRPDLHVLNPGDYLLIPAGSRHRVEWTDPEGQTVWLALHYR